MVLRPTKPDAVRAALRLRSMFPYRGDALIAALQKENREKKILPEWRENQIARLIKAVNMFAADFDERYRARRIDALANAARNLLELYAWARFCNLSDEDARIFFEDGARDLREMLDSMQELYTLVNGMPEEHLARVIDRFHAMAGAHGVKDLDDRYIRVRDAAKKVGNLEAFSAFYKAFSKLAHPTSLFLSMDPQAGGLSEWLDSLYEAGEKCASGALRELEKSIRAAYPSLLL